MNWGKEITSESGFTLIETLVSMALLITVAIPVFSVVSNFVLDSRTEDMWKALSLAEAEVDVVSTLGDRATNATRTEGRLTLVRTVSTSPRRLDLDVAVSSGKVSILHLQRSFLR